MVPLRLQLQNFLSYGEAAPVLDLEGIHVACLSGGNGQGKSALLDAMTWAVWGEARKSSEARKPDEELLRIGARAMTVDFTFRVGGDELRVVRSYTESASGKTSKPGLEFQVRDGDDWRPLTGGSLRETQAIIDQRVGVDYETFINSTFLLQGRSDEFTKKKPGERKEILGKILALGRYEQMAQRAGQRWTRLRERAKTLEAEIERLDAALEPVGEWEAEREAVQRAVETAQAETATATAAVESAAARLSGLDAAAWEAATLREALADLARRDDKRAAEEVATAAKIAAADALLADAERIEADHARYEALRTERAALDEKASLFRGIEQQRHELRLRLQQKTSEAKAELVRLEGALQTLERQIEADTQALAGREEVDAGLARAEAAAAELAQLDAAAAERERLTKEIETLDKQLAAAKGELEGRLRAVQEEGTRLRAEADVAEAVDTAALAAAAAEGAAAAVRREALQAEGTEASQGVGTLDGRVQALAADRARVEAKRAKLAASEDEACPTCGTDLTAAHRAEVLAGYDAELAEIDRQTAAAATQRAKAVERRDALRAEYVRLGATVETGEAAARALAKARDEAERAAARQARLAALREEHASLRTQIADEAFATETRAERTAAVETLDMVAYDAEAHASARRDASLRGHFSKQRRALDVAAERLEQSRIDRARRQSELAERRAALDRGDHLAEGKARLDALDQQAATLGFDPAEHERVAKALDALADAPRRLAELLDARRSRAELAERRAALGDERRSLRAATEERQAALDALDKTLAERDAAETARVSAEAARVAAAARLSDAQARLGALTERLDRAARDRQRRADVKRELKDVTRERALYGHLRRAFGKNGIPSLIIEETLPEIEQRANALLDRLSKGRTRVALETLKDKKTGGGTKETLDIRITDDQGVARSYETFSGGEAFRVNFALRIALSQMLAERAGTQIRTLVIDEGFGTQDAEGLQALIGAIRAIQDDFETILVITHLDEIKDAFPVRIEVRKEPVTGSTFDVVGA